MNGTDYRAKHRRGAHMVASILVTSSVLAACVPLEYALRFLDLVAEAEHALHPPTVVPAVVGSTLVGPLWTVHNLYAPSNFGDPEICATNTGVALAGFRGSPHRAGVLLLDATSGEQVWARTGLGVWRVACSPDAVFLAWNYSIWRRNPTSGRAEWHRTVGVPGDIIHLHQAGGNLYVWTRPDDATMVLDAVTGDIAPLPTVNDGRALLLVQTDAVFAGYGSLSFFDSDAGQPRWRAVLNGGIYETPFFTDSAVYVRTGETLGTVHALDRSSGEILWSTDRNIRSNLLVSSESLYVLTNQGQLQSIDPISGQPTTLLTFQPAHLPVGGDLGGYYLALSEEPHRLYIYLGYTGELMAFDVLPE